MMVPVNLQCSILRKCKYEIIHRHGFCSGELMWLMSWSSADHGLLVPELVWEHWGKLAGTFFLLCTSN